MQRPIAAGDNDGAGADEADACNHLGAQTAHIGIIVHVKVEILAGEGGHTGAKANQNVGAETRRAALILTLDADQAAAYRRQQHAQGKGSQRQLPQGG